MILPHIQPSFNLQRSLLRFCLVALIAVGSGIGCWSYQIAWGQGAGDIDLPLCGARALLRKSDPYACKQSNFGGNGPNNPLTTSLVLLPFIALPDAIVAGAVFGMSSGLLAYGVLRHGPSWRLIIFASFPYLQALQLAQWSPLICAIFLLPALLPLILVKPQIGLPVLLIRFSSGRILSVGLFVILSLLIDPTWPIRWLTHVNTYDGFVPLLILPVGLLLVPAFWFWRSDQGKLLALMSCVPQRAFHDQLALLLVPQTLRQMLVLCAITYITPLLWIAGLRPVGLVIILSQYLPALAILGWSLRRQHSS